METGIELNTMLLWRKNGFIYFFFHLHCSLCVIFMILWKKWYLVSFMWDIIRVLRTLVSRSSRPEVLRWKVFLKISQNSQENTFARVSFNKETLLKKRLWHRYFPVDFVKFLRTPFFIEHLWWLVLDIPEITGIVIAFFVRQGILDKPGNVKGFFH